MGCCTVRCVKCGYKIFLENNEYGKGCPRCGKIVRLSHDEKDALESEFAKRVM